eukprot:TRINITY_DN32503_c0_g1_i1.p1 TRINITY_DN32503_c0_g1~~TRINITY_DN32503_c0_g1_i1.p1  ORF type:complete len:196 (-),score=78.85 TRINITY_DN32503_c0_g1_i1:51-581(-)
MSQGKPLTHFQAMAMLRKALVASFIATPSNNKNGNVEMKSTENRRLSNEAVKEEPKEGQEPAPESVPVEKVKCLVLKDDPDEENLKDEDDKERKTSGAVKLVSKIAGKKSAWKIVEKEFVQGKDVSKNDAWKLILLSDLFPKGTTSMSDIMDEDEDDSDYSGEDDDEEDDETIVNE